MPTIKEIGANILDRVKAVARRAPKNAEEAQVDATAGKVKIAAKATIEKSVKSMLSRVREWSKETIAFLKAKILVIKSKAFEAKSKISQGVSKAVDKVARKVLNKKDATQEAAEIEMKNIEAKNEQKKVIKQHIKEVIDAAYNLENIHPETTEYCTRRQEFRIAVKAFLNDLFEGNLSKEEFVEILNAVIAKYPDMRIFVNERFNENKHDQTFSNIGKKLSVKKFFDILIPSRLTQVREGCKKEILAVAQEFAKALKNVKNIEDASRFSLDKFNKISELAEKKEYKNILGMNKEQIARALNAQIIAKLGGKEAVEQLIKQIDNEIHSPYDFDKATVSKRTAAEKRIADEVAVLNKALLDYETRLKELNDQERTFDEVKLSLLKEYRNSEEASEMHKNASEEISRIDNQKMLIQEQIQTLSEEVKKVEATKAQTLENYRLEHLCDLNTLRRLLGGLIGKDLTDIEALPRNATKMDSIKRHSKDAAMYGVRVMQKAAIPAALLAASAYGYHTYV